MADQGVVIGIDSYPGMQDLKGPCNDAEAFRDWLVADDGGGLDDARVAFMTTRQFPPITEIGNAHPVLDELETLFRPLVKQAAHLQHTEGRLFIFAAGHGFADTQEADSAALYAANAELEMPTHLALMKYADFFRRTWAFDEVILILDACRVTNPFHQIGFPPLPRVTPHPSADKVKTFTAYAAGFNRTAREREFEDGRVRGIFTVALLDALRNATPNRLGRVNGTAVKRLVHNSLDRFAGSVAITPPQINADENKDVSFSVRAPSAIPVSFQIQPQYANLVLVIATGALEAIYRAPITSTDFKLDLAPGLYKAWIEGAAASTLFEVSGHVSVSL
ncbi:caspase family protein [Thiocystis violacea]|uniref:caspase family protein n=1 Tax=Thiocystis violacea TaxID=13725 RepID=UPI0019044444|nr:caspase family protein [Thiocystis violacea]MBK1722143.1 hypothetical protein [Thiocystis violacea]